MTPDELYRELESGALRPAYLVVGEEPLLRDDTVAAIRAAALAPGAVDFNLDRLDGERVTPAGLLEAVETLPVMAERRLVILREPEGGRGRGVADAVAEAVKSLREADGRNILVVVAEKADRRARWTRAFADPAAVVTCDAPRDARKLAAFIRSEAERQGVSLARSAAERLAERTGPQLLLLRQEIAKAALLAGPGESVTQAHVSAGASDMAEDPIWDLTDAIGEGRAAEAVRLLARILRAGAPGPVVLGALASHFRRLLRVRHGGRVSAQPFVRRKLEGQAGRYSPGRLDACLRAIHETDTALKGQGSLPPELALERLVLGLSG